MTIRKGEAWGAAAEVPANLVQVPDDRQLHHVVNRLRRQGELTPIGIYGGDLARTAGGGAGQRLSGMATKVSFDVCRVSLADGATHWFVAHLVARRSWLRDPLTLVMNAQFLGEFDVAPRSHPNDGRADVLTVAPEMSPRARLQARSRARRGTHLPHPHLSVTQVSSYVEEFTRPRVVWLDGVRVGVSSSLDVTVEADALEAYV